MPVLDPGPTPANTLVFVPDDGRDIAAPDNYLLEPLPSRAFRNLLRAPRSRSTSWILVPCLVSLRTEFNRLAPDRDKSSDGSIGDTSHAASSSDHNPDESGATPYEDSDNINEVHAIDVDVNLNRSGWTMQRAVNIIVANHKAGRDDRLQYVIYNRKIYSRSWGWTARDYTGASPHTEHAHFSARYTTAQESDTSPWGLLEEAAPQPTPAPEEDDGMADITQARFNELMTTYINGSGRDAWAPRLLSYDPGADANGKTPNGAVKNLTTDDPSNPTVGPATALERAQVAAVLGYQIRTGIETLLEAVSLLAKSVAAGETADAADREAILSRIDAARDQLLAELNEPPTGA